MWMFGIIASGIFPVLHIHYSRAVALTVLAYHEAFALLCVNIGYECFSRFEVIANSVWLVLILTLFKDRLSNHLTRGIWCTIGMYQTTIQTYGYVISC